MRVEIEHLAKNQNVDRAATSNRDTQVSRNDRTGVITVDISGVAMDDKAYEGQGKTAEDIKREAELGDTALMKNYMVVMSNSMSDEDFAKLGEDGYHPADTEIETVVTVVDKIKAELVQAGVIVSGYTDDLSLDKLKKITGSEARALEIVDALSKNDVPVTEDNVKKLNEALQKAESLAELTDGAKKYMVQNLKEPTIDNVYAARFSASADGSRQGKGYFADDMSGYYAKKAEDYNWEQLKPQMEKVIQDSGREVNKSTLDDAKWLIEKGVPLTKESFACLERIKEISINEDQRDYINRIAQTMGEGRNAGEALLSSNPGIYEQAADLLEEVDRIGQEAIEAAVAEGKPLNLKNLTEAQKRIEAASAETTAAVRKESGVEKDSASIAALTARRQLEEIRLQMTLEANVKLLKSGFSIDTAPLQEVVEALKNAEREQRSVLFGEGDERTIQGKASLYEETISKVTDMASMPAAVIGKAVTSGLPFTLNYIHEEGMIQKSAYDAAGETYEALMTAPRSDLGDSIKKAFRNVDELLDEIQLERTVSNQRAVRILGYNQMEITQENVDKIKAADEDVQRVIRKMTPASVLQMIRDGINPLETGMSQLEAYLSEQESGTGKEAEKYFKFLYKMEQNKQISEEEKEAYIGIYRLVRQIEKSDGAVIGSLLNQGTELSFKNLLQAVRTQKKKGMDVTVDEEFGGVKNVHKKADSISDQIESGYKQQYQKNMAKDILDHMEPGALAGIDPEGEMTLEQLAQLLKQQEEGQSDKDSQRSYTQNQMENIRQIQDVEDYVLQALTEFDQPVTVDNLLAAHYLCNSRGGSFKNLFEKAEGQEREKLEKAVEKLQDSFTDEETAQRTYGELHKITEEMTNQRMDTVSSSIDIKSMALTFKQISLAANLSKEENYEVPVKIGDEVTSINLRIIRGVGEDGKVTATMETREFGKIAAEFTVTKNGISGYLVSNQKNGAEMMRRAGGRLSEALTEKGKEIKDICYIVSGDLNINTFSRGDRGEGKVSSRELYMVAKEFIGSVQKELRTDHKVE